MQRGDLCLGESLCTNGIMELCHERGARAAMNAVKLRKTKCKVSAGSPLCSGPTNPGSTCPCVIGTATAVWLRPALQPEPPTRVRSCPCKASAIPCFILILDLSHLQQLQSNDPVPWKFQNRLVQEFLRAFGSRLFCLCVTLGLHRSPPAFICQ